MEEAVTVVVDMEEVVEDMEGEDTKPSIYRMASAALKHIIVLYFFKTLTEHLIAVLAKIRPIFRIQACIIVFDSKTCIS